MEPQAYARLIELQGAHWWYRARRKIVRTVLLRHAPQGGRVLEVGAGAGGNIPMLREWGAVTALEPHPPAADHIAAHFDVEVVREAIPPSPPDLGRFQTVVALDVLEHIPDDAGALRFLRDSLAPGGTCVVTVPAYPFLWSSHDVTLHHRRRYRKSGLVRKMRAAGFDIRFASYYGLVLLPPAILLRIVDRIRPGVGRFGADAPPRWINRCLHALFAAEAHLLPRVPLPAGLSAVVVGTAPGLAPGANPGPGIHAARSTGARPGQVGRPAPPPHWPGRLIRTA